MDRSCPNAHMASTWPTRGQPRQRPGQPMYSPEQAQHVPSLAHGKSRPFPSQTMAITARCDPCTWTASPWPGQPRTSSTHVQARRCPAQSIYSPAHGQPTPWPEKPMVKPAHGQPDYGQYMASPNHVHCMTSPTYDETTLWSAITTRGHPNSRSAQNMASPAHAKQMGFQPHGQIRSCPARCQPSPWQGQ
jgi:hypothetical protein